MFIRAKDSKEFEMQNSRPISFPAQTFLKDVLGLDVDILLFLHIRVARFFLTLYCSSQIRTVYACSVFAKVFGPTSTQHWFLRKERMESFGYPSL